MAQLTQTYSLLPATESRRRRDRLLAWLALFGCAFALVMVFSLGVDPGLFGSAIAVPLVWAFLRLHALSTEVDEVEQGERSFMIRRFGKRLEYSYQDIGGLATFSPSDFSGSNRLVAEVRATSGKRICRFSEDFPLFTVLVADFRQRLERAGVSTGDAEANRAARLKRRRLSVRVASGFAVLLLLIALVLGYFTLRERAESKMFLRHGMIAEAVIARHYRQFRPYLDIRFTDHRGVERLQSRSLVQNRWESLAVGDRIIITYLPDDPEVSTLARLSITPLWLIALFVGLLGLPALILLVMSGMGYCLEQTGGRLVLLRPGELVEDRL